MGTEKSRSQLVGPLVAAVFAAFCSHEDCIGVIRWYKLAAIQ